MLEEIRKDRLAELIREFWRVLASAPHDTSEESMLFDDLYEDIKALFS